jgi:malic enzyme
MDEFIEVIRRRCPKALLQFEDFKSPYAEIFLERYRNKLTCFNDDIQGTGAVALAGMYAAVRATDSTLAEQRIICVGAGAAGCGVSSALVQGMQDSGGLSREEALSRVWLIDENGASAYDVASMQLIGCFAGVLTQARSKYLDSQKQFLRKERNMEGMRLADLVRCVQCIYVWCDGVV